jgi:hypothetical protein
LELIISPTKIKQFLENKIEQNLKKKERVEPREEDKAVPEEGFGEEEDEGLKPHPFLIRLGDSSGALLDKLLPQSGGDLPLRDSVKNKRRRRATTLRIKRI